MQILKYKLNIQQKLIIWGAGHYGKELISWFGSEVIVAIIDSDVNKVGSRCCNIPIIDIKLYEKKYNGNIIIIAIKNSNILEKLGRQSLVIYCLHISLEMLFAKCFYIFSSSELLVIIAYKLDCINNSFKNLL